MNKTNIGCAAAALFIMANVVHAEPRIASASNCAKHVFIGYGLSQTNHYQTLRLANTPAPGLTNAYDSDSYAASAVLLGLGVDKVVKTLENNAQFSLGAEIDYLRNDALKGTVHPMINVNPNFDTLRFSYDNQSLLLFATAKISKENLSKENLSNGWGAYVNAGLGGALNRLSNYHEFIPQGSTAAPMLAPFKSRNKGDFAISAGLGVSHEVGQNSRVSFGYRYLNSGRGRLGTTAVQQTTQTLSSARLGHHVLNVTVTV